LGEFFGPNVAVKRLTVAVNPAGIRYYGNLPEPLTTPLPEIANIRLTPLSGQTEDGSSVSATPDALRANDSSAARGREPSDQARPDPVAGLPRRQHGSCAGFGLLGGSSDTSVPVPALRRAERGLGRVVECRSRKVVCPVFCPPDGPRSPEPGGVAARDAGRGARSIWWCGVGRTPPSQGLMVSTGSAAVAPFSGAVGLLYW
jgi:hypothetical protein